MDMNSVGRLLIVGGAILVTVGALFLLLGRIPGLRFGELPGDIRIEGRGYSCFFPLASMIILSLLLTLALNIVVRLINR